MIFAFLHELQPGQRQLIVEGRTIQLDPQQRPVEAAQERFKAYDKAKSAVEGLPERLRHCDVQLAGLAQISALVGVADEYEQLALLEAEAEEQGYLKLRVDGAKRRKVKRIKPLHLHTSEGFDVFIGRSAAQNEEVTFRIGHSDDLWLHVRTIHGAHVIIRREGREVPEQSLREAAGLAAYFSQAREEKAVDVDISRRSLVRKVPGGPVGLVTYRAEQTLRVAPRAPAEPVRDQITRAPR
jgi:predicted ribosome quality control (RQC) complex YloA/Tae2 family protein